MLDYDRVMALKTGPQERHYTDKDVILYALGIGFGRDPMDEAELAYVHEKSLRTVPTAATVLPIRDMSIMERSGINYTLVLHGEQRIRLERPLPPAATIVCQQRVIGLYDKGKDKGAVLQTETQIREKSSDALLATLVHTTFARGDGGFGGPKSSGEEPHRLPERAPDAVSALTTRPDQAALYRLNGDRNPLHIDPGVARAAGFERPILHGLCTYGIACRAILKEICAYDHTRISGFDVRFSAPVVPGETIVTEMWQDKNVVSFRCTVKERSAVVLNNGKCTLFP